MSTAVVACEVASEPASGSLKQKEPMISPEARRVKYLAFCSADPKVSSPQQTKLLFTLTTTDAEASIFDNSSMART